ncbi:MAG: YkvA family protein [Thermomicrobiales bacterium]
MKRLLRFRSLMRLPHLLRLSFRLIQDARVPTAAKAMTIGAIALVLSPLDLPGWVPIIGQGLDIVVITAILERFIKSAPGAVVREHAAALDPHGEFAS